MLKRFISWLLPAPSSDVLQPRPRVKPDPQQTAELERRCAAINYEPEIGFIKDHRQEKIV